MKFMNKLFRCEAGATAIEYGLIAALIAIAVITALQGLGEGVEASFHSAASGIAEAA